MTENTILKSLNKQTLNSIFGINSMPAIDTSALFHLNNFLETVRLEQNKTILLEEIKYSNLLKEWKEIAEFIVSKMTRGVGFTRSLILHDIVKFELEYKYEHRNDFYEKLAEFTLNQFSGYGEMCYLNKSMILDMIDAIEEEMNTYDYNQLVSEEFGNFYLY